MARGRGLVGRDDDLAAVDRALEELTDLGGLVVVQGDPGSGRTALLDEIQRTWSARDTEVIRVPLGDTPDWDLFGARALLDAVRDRFERLGGRQLADVLTATGRLCGPETYLDGGDRGALLAELTRLFTCLRRDRRVIVLVDDVHVLASPLPGIAAVCRAGCAVVATYTEERAVSELTPLVAVARHRVDLVSLSDEDVETLIATWAGAAVDAGVPSALRNALGPLAGNPATVLATVHELQARDRLVELRGVRSLRERTAPIALPTAHPTVRQVIALGETARALVVLVGTSDGLGVDDVPGLAVAIGCGPAECGEVLDQLVHLGALRADPVGRLTCPCPALTAAVVSDMGDPAVRQLHAGFARHLLRRDRDVLARHVLRAGSALPTTPEIFDRLVVGNRIAAAPAERAARRYHAALLHADRGHPEVARIVSDLLRLLIRIGRFDWLGEVVEAVATEHAATQAAELACAAALATLHTGRPVAAGVRAALSATPSAAQPLRLCDRWLASDLGVSAEDVAAAFAPLCADSVPPGRRETLHRHDELLVASSCFDLVTVFEDLFGAAYRAPLDGPLAAYHRVLAGYIDGQWDDALSAATDLDLTATAYTPALTLSRLFAAEICSNRGDYRQARSWLAEVPADGHLVAAHSWVEIGMIAREGDPEAAFREGVRAYVAARSHNEDFAMGLLLLRLAYGAKNLGHTGWMRRLLADAEVLYRRRHDEASHVTMLMTRGLVADDTDAALEAVRLARHQGYQVQLAQACVIAAATAADPLALFCEAHTIAAGLGAESLRTMIRTMMRRSGIQPPRAQASSAGFSDTETRIIELIREGRTNRQIAARLRVSEKTVEDNLTRLFVRTGFRSRLTLAAASAAGDLATS
jgi:DNA-binding CsgD family transcriptional regulator